MSDVVRIFVDENGSLIGIYSGGEPDSGLEVPTAPDNGLMKWDFKKKSWYWPIETAATVARQRLNFEFSQAMQQLQAPWPLLEVLTWDRQSYEAARWITAPADAKPETPFLTSLFEKCAALGAKDTFEALVGRIRANDKAYTDAVTSIMAVRHVAESQIEESAEPMTVTWQFP